MNNPRTLALGWGSLTVAAGVSFYFAKKTINERRREQAAAGSRPTEILDWKARVDASVNEKPLSAAAGGGIPNMPASGSESISQSVEPSSRA